MNITSRIRPWTSAAGIAAALVFFLMLVGCKGMIHVDAIKPSVNDITARHDAYVQQDASIGQQSKDAFLLESRLLREVVEEASK